MSEELTLEEVIVWLKNNTDPQDTGASNVSRAIGIFEEAARKIRRPAPLRIPVASLTNQPV
jgi:hypothetical protein